MNNPHGFWETVHISDDRYWLTGSSPSEVLQLHGVEVEPKQVVVDLGVGTGGMTQYLTDRGCVVVAVDISLRALEKVFGKAVEVYLSEDLEDLRGEFADWVICHLVLQHCEPAEVERLLCESRRLLRPTGRASFQWASVENNNAQISRDDQTRMEARQLVFHTPEFMEAALGKAGFKHITHRSKDCYGAFQWWISQGSR